jgi:hypothetical protein
MRIASATVLRGRTGRHACSKKGKRTCISVISDPAAAEKPQADSRLVSKVLSRIEDIGKRPAAAKAGVTGEHGNGFFG